MNSHGRRLRRLCEASGGRLASLAYTPAARLHPQPLALTTPHPPKKLPPKKLPPKIWSEKKISKKKNK